MSRDTLPGSGHGRSIDRRAFLRYGAIGGAMAAVAAPGDAIAAPAAGEDPPALGQPFELEEATIADLQQRMKSGQDTARSLVERYLARIEALDKRGPSLNQVLEINPDALEIADRLDAERKVKGGRGPLHGIPVLLKDNVGTADRMTTTAGSLALEGSIPPKDSFVAQRLRAAGAILLGKTNMSEWANFRSTHSSSGWSGRGGQGRNPYALDRNTSGSSSGSGAAVAANYAPLGIGTETDGSIVSPANNNSIVGIKPTIGLVSRVGIIPIAHSQDTAGPMARSVADAAILLGALAGADPGDPVTRNGLKKGERDYAKFLDPNGLKGVRLGVPRKKLFGDSPAADRLVEAAIADMKKLGAIIIDPADIPTIGQVDKSEFEVLLYEFKADLNAYLASLGPKAPIHSLKEAIEFNDTHRDREMPYFGQEIFLQAEEKGPLTSKAYLTALSRNHQLTRAGGIDAVMNRHKLDALVAPTSAPPSLTDLVNGDYGPGGSSTFPAVAGYPHITVPAGYYFGLPVGISFFGRAFSEPTLIRVAYAFEQATRHRRPPMFLPTADLSLRG
jgi:amidase